MIDELLVEIQRIKRDLEALLSREASGVNASGWVSFGVTLTYASATTITLPGDYTAILSVGDKLRYTQSGSVKYAHVMAVSYSSPSTTITINAGSDYTLTNAAITAPMYSKISNPVGLPYWFGQSVCRVIRTTAQTISTGSMTPVSFDLVTNTYDHAGASTDNTNSFWAVANPTRLTATNEGWYEAGGGAAFSSSAAGFRHAIKISHYKSDGTTTVDLAQNENHTLAGRNSYLTVSSGPFYMHQNDYIVLSVFQDSGGNKDTRPATLTGNSEAHFWIHRLKD